MTPKEEAFCVKYLKDRNGAHAAIRTGYSAKTAKDKASTLLRHPLIEEKIGLATAEVAKAAKGRPRDLHRALGNRV